jgi:hypothetical protein
MSREAGLDRVEGEIAGGGEQVFVARDFAGQEVGAEKMRAAAVHAVVVARVRRVELLERQGDARIRRLEDEVIVVRHEGVGDKLKLVSSERARELSEKGAAIVVREEGASSVAGMRREVVDPVVEFARPSGHSSTLRVKPAVH